MPANTPYALLAKFAFVNSLVANGILFLQCTLRALQWQWLAQLFLFII